MIEALDIHVTGIVQGVGFRPFVYRMAKKYLINGWVLNAADGVNIHAEGESRLLDEFVIELSENAPAAAQVKEIELKEVPLQDFDSFEIRFSDDAAVQETTLVSADLATCDDCAAELFNPNDRRFRYPFINCTNCGPRFTIIDALPYDRASTSMRDFPMCEPAALPNTPTRSTAASTRSRTRASSAARTFLWPGAPTARRRQARTSRRAGRGASPPMSFPMAGASPGERRARPRMPSSRGRSSCCAPGKSWP